MKNESAKSVIVTCSMYKDIELFDILSRSIDECVNNEVRHIVIVPKGDLAKFKKFANLRRDVIAQEDVIPMKLFKFGRFPEFLTDNIKSLRRPFYLSRDLQIMRGWIIQQMLKIEICNQLDNSLIIHVDSDVMFVKETDMILIKPNGNQPFFRVDSATGNPLHRPWVAAAANVLGLDLPDARPSHYVENCVPWRADVVKLLIDRIQSVNKKPWYDVIKSLKTFSEYYIYGIFVDEIHGISGLYTENTNFCRSWWPEDEAMSVDPHDLVNKIEDHQFAIAVQSTAQFSKQSRVDIYQTARKKFMN